MKMGVQLYEHLNELSTVKLHVALKSAARPITTVKNSLDSCGMIKLLTFDF